MYRFDGMPPEACPACRARKDAQYQEARMVVKENPGITALEVHERTGVPLPNIARYIELGYFEIVGQKKDMDVAEVQIWVRQVKEQSKKDKAKKKAADEAAAAKPEILPEIGDEDIETPSKKKKGHTFDERW
jgi:hypothetical protein